MAKEITIQSLDPNTFEFQTYSEVDTDLIVQSQLDTVFSNDTDYIEYYIYDQNQNLIFPSTTTQLLDYDVREGDVILSPSENLSSLGYNLGIYNILYTFYRKRLASNISEKYFISNISSDRTEIRLDSNVINNDLIISSSNDFIEYRENSEFFVDFYLNFGNNQTVIANNIKLETEEDIDPTILIKLYEPLPDNFSLKDELWVVEELSLPQAYQLDFPFEPIIEDDFTFISGPNYNIDVIQQTSTGGESITFSTLLDSNLTSSVNQLKNILDKKEVNININYANYSNFIHFSSAKTRLENFYYKVGLIESYNTQLGELDLVTGDTIFTPSFSSSRLSIKSKIDEIVKNFDGYESFLYYDSGSLYSYPKQNLTPPFKLYSTGSTEVLNWIGSADPNNVYYGGQALSASNFDSSNRDSLFYSIPEYLRDDPANQGYELFVDMVGQYYDNVWVYTKDISNKFDADNRLEFGISKDLVADAIRDFGVKLYASNFNTNDLFTAFLGLTTTGSLFPFPNITGSLPTETGYEYVNTQISASNDIVPLNNVQKQLYKRIYHNIPYLLKTKGTVAGLRALITSYGIPDTILRINEFGGKDKNEYRDYDLEQRVFNYAYDTGILSSNILTSSFDLNSKFNTGFDSNSPQTIQFRFKSAGIPTSSNNTPSSHIRYSQSLWLSDNSSNGFTSIATAIVLEYTGSGFVTGSYSGSIASPYDTWGTLKFYPDIIFNPTVTCSVFAPFFNKDWWSLQVTLTGSSTTNVTASLFAANEIDGKIGFFDSNVKMGQDTRSWGRSNFAALNIFTNKTINGKVYEPFSGSFQEYRMFATLISESKFLDYTVNPYSIEGNTINSTPNELAFRADLGTQLDTGSRTSIHPRVTGSATQITQSFSNGTSDFHTISSLLPFVKNIEKIHQDQTPAGIKNRVTDKIQAEGLVLAEAPYGFLNPSSSTATISSPSSNVISPLESIQQHSYVSQSYTPNIDYLEVAFSPSNQINDDINAQLGYFNLGEYIGDPRFISSSDRSYPDLDILRDAYFEKYIRGYDIKDFVRLIKFFDNSLFKMIKDFTPARTSLASGVVVKQHILERNRQRQALVSSSFHHYTGSVVNLPKNYSTGSLDQPQYANSGSSLYKFSGGPGGSFNRYNSLNTSPSGSLGTGPNNRFNLTQSWSESFDRGSIDRSIINTTFFNQSSSQYISASFKGRRTGIIHSDQSEFYNGIFTGSHVEVTDQDLNPDCEPYLNVVDTPVVYKPIFFSTTSGSFPVVTKNEFLNQNNYPRKGFAWIGSEQTYFDGTFNGVSQVYSIKLSRLDVNGLEITNYLDEIEKLRFIFGDSSLPYESLATEYIVNQSINYGEHAVFDISQLNTVQGNNFPQEVDGVIYYPITSSNKGGSDNFSLEAKTSYNTGTGVGGNTTESADNVQQNTLTNPNSLQQEQNIFNWNGLLVDPLGFFNVGDENVNTRDILDSQNNVYTNAAYTIPYTPNIPLIISASILYTSSFNSLATGTIQDSGIYHSASVYEGFNKTNQDFYLGLNPTIFAIIGSFLVDTSAAKDTAQEANDDTSTPTSVGGNVIKIFSDVISPNQVVFANDDGTVSGFTTTFFGNDLLSTTPSLTAGKFYKFANGTSTDGTPEYFVAQVSLTTFDGGEGITLIFEDQQLKSPGGRSIAAFQPTQETPPSSAGLSNLFRPAPRFVQDLGTISFNGNLDVVDQNIPGNSGSGTDMTILAGHPKIKTAGLAKMDFTFPSLKFAGTVPTLNSDNNFVKLSGSEAPGAGSNNDFTAGFSGAEFQFDDIAAFYTTTAGGNVGQEYNGGIGVSVPEIRNAYISLFGYINMLRVKSANFLISLEMQALEPYRNFNIRFKANVWNPATQTFRNSSFIISDKIHSINGKIILNDFNFNAEFVTGGLYFSSAYNDSIVIFLEIQNTSNLTETISYTLKLRGLRASFGLSDDVSEIPSVLTLPPTGSFLLASGSGADNLFQNSSSAEANTGPDFYNSALISASLKRTGSQGDFIITSSLGFSGSVYPGGTFVFPSSSILNIEHNSTYAQGNPATHNTTQNQIGDLFYVEYSASNFGGGVIGGVTQTSQLVEFESDSDLSTIAITQSYTAGGGAFNATGSLIVRKTNRSVLDNPPTILPLGDKVAELPFILVSQSAGSAVGPFTAEVSGSYTGSFFHDDIFRFSIGVDKVSNASGINVLNLTASLFPSQSKFSPISTPFGINNFRAPANTSLVVENFYAGAVPFNLALNCQPLLNNYVSQRTNPYLFNVDYNFQESTIFYSSSLTPVNFVQILNKSAVKSTVPESNYTEIRSINPRYNGSRSTSKRLNVYNEGDTGTFGRLPNIELRDALFGYFNDLDDPYPIINNLTRVNLNYLIDEQGNALPPSLDQSSIDTFQQVFPLDTIGTIAAKSGKNNFKSLGEGAPIIRAMEYLTPVMYSQISGDNYSNVLPLSGSGFVFRFDNDNPNDPIFLYFNALGPSSIDTSSPQQSVSFILNPTSSVTPNGTSNKPFTMNPYQEGNMSPDRGAIFYSASATAPSFRPGSITTPGINNALGENGQELGFKPGTGKTSLAQQIVTLSHTFVTSHVSETSGTQNELSFQLNLYTGSATPRDPNSAIDFTTGVSFNLEDIRCKVHTDQGQVYDMGSVLSYGWLAVNSTVRSTVLESLGFLSTTNYNIYTSTARKIDKSGLRVTVDWEMYDTLFDLGLMRQKKPAGGSGVKALEWTIKANTGNYPIKVGDVLRWKFNGSFKRASGNHTQGFFFPDGYNGVMTSTNIQGIGAYDYLLSTQNTASAPFWVFSGSTGGNNNIVDPTFLVMSSSNLNEAYGTNFKQADLEYLPGPSDYFPFGLEPSTTQFEKINYPLELKEGDEIRFGNNENFTYKIKQVIPPESNTDPDPIGNRLKIQVDRPVNVSINKDFFLVRRTISNPNSLYLNTPFPYQSLASASIRSEIKNFTGSLGLSGSLVNLGGNTGSTQIPAGIVSGSFTGSFADLELSSTPGILYPDFPTEFLIKSASSIVNDLITKGIIES